MNVPEEVPVMTLPEATLFPQALLPLYIFEPRYRKMLRDALDSHRLVTVAMQKPGRTRETPCSVAGLGLIRVSVKHTDGTSHLVLQGLSRVELVERVRSRPYRVHRMRVLTPLRDEETGVQAAQALVLELTRQCLARGACALPFPGAPTPSAQAAFQKLHPEGFSTEDVFGYLKRLNHPETLADFVSVAMLRSPLHRQAILETLGIEARLRALARFLMAQLGHAPEDTNP
jgi:ATP-dependent Lon protease